jgi:hypothetical protein
MSLVDVSADACTTPCDADKELCNTDADVCYPKDAVANKACTTKTDKGVSLTLGGQCVSDCPSKADPTTFISVNGMHWDTDQKKCVDDAAAADPKTANNVCVPKTDGSSVNMVTEACEVDCKTVTPGSHANADADKCVPDSSTPAPGDVCKADTDCKDTKYPNCEATTGTCYDSKAAKNAECTKKADGMSVTLGGECVSDCK